MQKASKLQKEAAKKSVLGCSQCGEFVRRFSEKLLKQNNRHLERENGAE